MERKKIRLLVKLIAIILVASLCTPIGAQAAVPETVQPMASAYLLDYTAYICAMGSGELEIWFEITGTRTQEYLGVMSIFLYESTDNVNWSWVETFRHTDYEQMLLTNVVFNVNHVDYDEAVPGRYYKAYVGIWGGPDPGGDSRYIWTDVERAT